MTSRSETDLDLVGIWSERLLGNTRAIGKPGELKKEEKKNKAISIILKNIIVNCLHTGHIHEFIRSSACENDFPF